MTGEEPRFETQWLRWIVERSSHPFRAYVVEPHEYNPVNHTAIFDKIISSFFSPETDYIEDGVPLPHSTALKDYDLLVFPEIFVPADHLVSVLKDLPLGNGCGCIHTGLRPSEKDSPHLFFPAELQSLLEDLKALDRLEKSDLKNFSDWLQKQEPTDRFNISCLAAIDVHGHIRVCLHPKMVRSKLEYSFAEEGHLTEGSILSLVTLQPEETSLSPITIQPLICADMLELETDRPANHPIPAITTHRNCFTPLPPEHVDIVSVTTATPSEPRPSTVSKKQEYVWSSYFRNSFVSPRSISNYDRHRYAVFILANFRTLLENNTGGLSGAFIPIKRQRQEPIQPYLAKRMTIYGSFPNPKGNEERIRWIGADDNNVHQPNANEYAHILSLDPNAWQTKVIAILFGFTINRLPRYAGSSYSCQIVRCSLHELTSDLHLVPWNDR